MNRKNIWPVTAGFLLLAVLSVAADALLRTFFPGTFGLSGRILSWLAAVIILGYGAAFGVLSGYLTARLAATRPMLHATALAGILFVFALGGELMSWQSAPIWFNLGFLAMIFPSAWLGGLLRVRQLRL